jgi:hypothetical protein
MQPLRNGCISTCACTRGSLMHLENDRNMQCYAVSLVSDAMLRWESLSLGLNVASCLGGPHLRISLIERGAVSPCICNYSQTDSDSNEDHVNEMQCQRPQRKGS